MSPASPPAPFSPPGDADHARILAALATIEQDLASRARPCRIKDDDAHPIAQVALGFGVLHAVYAAKLRSIASALGYAISAREFLVYAAAGRMLIEHFAILIYYGRDKIAPLLKHGNPVGLGDDEAKALGGVLDQFLSGNRHDWGPLLRDHFPAHLTSRRQPRQQVNILTCLKKWNRVEGDVDELYEMFCDMVHPNAGSLFLFLHREGDALIAADPERASIADVVIGHTAPRLVAILQRAPEVLDQLAHVADAAAWAAAKTRDS